jgi:uncharacterized protein (TIGR00106 family)
VVPIGKGESVSKYVAECLRIVESSGMNYRINPMGTVVEGGYEECMDLIRRCHQKVRGMCPRVITSIKIDDREGMEHALEKKITSVEEKVGKELKR